MRKELGFISQEKGNLSGDMVSLKILEKLLQRGKLKTVL